MRSKDCSGCLVSEPVREAETEVRPWVKRVGVYLRIFGVRPVVDPRTVEHWIERAKEAEATPSEPVREAETRARIRLVFDEDASDQEFDAAVDALDALLADRDRLAGEAETYRAALEKIAALPMVKSASLIADFALSDSKEEE